MRTKIETTADGSHTLFVPELDEHYHSVNGAVQESMHIFIRTGLHHHPERELNIFEIGFGTGLNAYLTAIDAEQNNRLIRYTSIEAYPVDQELASQLNYPSQAGQRSDLFASLHVAEWDTPIRINDNFILHKIEADFTKFDFSRIEKIDIVYFDAFAPEKQSDMWSQELFDNLYRVMNNGGILVTYCAKGVVRRMMQQSGFMVERLPGPPGKREMLRATKI
ncbi:tRNA (5-methylaminomethyl-2-thiouridine)(34)-methyltransferase MnmD [Dysgonomonas massiliensis]|uniref:tRNA (5-methylaminomethyl-2-thiouridine)(34)-methyltransferase MnmD n=1 Tax=Dysgonomonas massiliensis TaxID=2040292 RepID=UPI000C75EEAC|nr:tRNA (5-methylaminomethyl-2-thiouridine)(34)-methyltransferase MnmD [Dysgonomonas massiliensis]